jgi:HEAT repeat protein
MTAMRKAWWPILAEAAVTTDPVDRSRRPVVRRRERLILLREWSRFRGLVHGRASANLNALAIDLGLLPLARREMRRRLVDHRLLGLRAVGQMKDVDSWDLIATSIENDNIALAVTAATALADIDPDRAIPRIVPIIARSARWPRTQVGRILNGAGPEIVSLVLCREIADAPAGQAVRLLQFADSAFDSDINAVAERLLMTRDEPGLLSAALKAARGRICPERVRELTGHETWFVRMQAATLLGRAGLREDLPALEPLLADAQWWVRYRAAQALVASPYLGPNAIRRIAGRQEDPFACDILQQALAEKGLA